MKPIFLIFILWPFLPKHAAAQNIHREVSQPTPLKRDSLDRKTFYKVLNQQFTTIITGQAKNSIGNFASLDIKEPEVSFAGSAIINENKPERRASILTIKASGGISDGLFSIFNNSTLNTSVALDLRYHLLNRKHLELSYLHVSQQALEEKQASIRYKHKMDTIAITSGQDTNSLVLKKSELKKMGDSLSNLLATENNVQKKIDLRYRIRIINEGIDSLTNVLTSMPPAFRRLEVRNNQLAIDLKAVSPDINVYAFKFKWFTFGYKVQNDAFKIFSSKLPYEVQIQKSSFASQEATAQYSVYKWSTQPYKTYLFLIGMGVSYTHNLDQLTKTEITEVKNFGPLVNDRISTNKYNVYTGDYQKNLKGLRLYADYYRFLFNDNHAAIHGFPEVIIKDKSKPWYNWGLGFLLSFKDSKDEKSIVNAELYYKFLDLFKGADTKDKFFERNEVGIRFSFPINFKIK